MTLVVRWRRPGCLSDEGVLPCPGPGALSVSAVSELRAQGRHRPELRDAQTGFLALGLATHAPVALLVWLYIALGVSGLVLGVVLLGGAVRPGLIRPAVCHPSLGRLTLQHGNSASLSSGSDAGPFEARALDPSCDQVLRQRYTDRTPARRS